jgi:thiol-disulfide isomerase/thioredoxin
MAPWICTMIILFSASVMGQSQEDNGDQNPFGGTPKEIIESEGIAIPVFDYKGFEPIISQSDGKTYVINFWATWCKPCVEEIPGFVKYLKESKSDSVEMIFVSLDFRSNIQSSVIPFIRAKGMTGHVLVLSDPNANDWIDRIDPNWSGAIPSTLIFRNGKRSFYEGSMTYEKLKTNKEAIYKQ